MEQDNENFPENSEEYKASVLKNLGFENWLPAQENENDRIFDNIQKNTPPQSSYEERTTPDLAQIQTTRIEVNKIAQEPLPSIVSTGDSKKFTKSEFVSSGFEATKLTPIDSPMLFEKLRGNQFSKNLQNTDENSQISSLNHGDFFSNASGEYSAEFENPKLSKIYVKKNANSLGDLLNSKTKLNNQNKISKAEIISLDAQNKKLKENLTLKIQKNQSLNSRIKSLEKEMKTLEYLNEESKNAETNLKNENNKLKNENKDLNEFTIFLNKQALEKETELEKIKQDLFRKNKEINALNLKNKKTEKEFLSIYENIESVRNNEKEALQERDDLKTENVKLNKLNEVQTENLILLEKYKDIAKNKENFVENLTNYLKKENSLMEQKLIQEEKLMTKFSLIDKMFYRINLTNPRKIIDECEKFEKLFSQNEKLQKMKKHYSRDINFMKFETLQVQLCESFRKKAERREKELAESKKIFLYHQKRLKPKKSNKIKNKMKKQKVKTTSNKRRN